jgi:mannose-6-phosphate isomerase-like protein (cupin superfamily)
MQELRLPTGVALLWALVLGSTAFCQAQDRRQLPPEVATELAKSPKPPRSNQEVGVHIDRFVGSPLLSPVHVTPDLIFRRSVLRHGDPYHPGERAAVLENWNDLSLGTLLPHARSPLVKLAEEQFWYVESGEGKLDNGVGFWDLHEGVAILIPPNAAYRTENTTEAPLHLLTLNWTPSSQSAPRKEILVRDVASLPLPEQGYHWSYFGTDVFESLDGLDPYEVFAVVTMPPMTIAEPHAHIPHWDEVWVKLPPFSSYLILGSEVRDMPPNTGFLSPPNSATTHSVVNLMKDQSQKFLYLAHISWKPATNPGLPLVKSKPLGNAH